MTTRPAMLAALSLALADAVPTGLQGISARVDTEHAVGFIALSHLSEHFKEWLEDQDKPAHHVQERHRLDVLRIFAGGKQPYWPRHILWYHDWWDGHRGDMGCFVHANVQAELKAADKKGGGGH